MASKKSNFYLTREQLINEIIISKKKYRESNVPRTPAECFTTNLTEYLKLMVDRYANKGQWRGYCVDETTECLTQRGWLNIDQVTEYDIILSYNNGHLKWSKIKSIYRGDFDGNMFHLTVQGLDTLVTPGHKVVTTEGLKIIEDLREKDKILLLGSAVPSSETVYDDAFIELVGWAVTEGTYYESEDRTYTRITIYQNEGSKANQIRSCLNKLDATFGESDCKYPNIAFHLTKDLCNKVIKVAPDKVLTMPFILELSYSQRELLINTMVDGDGWRPYQKYRQYGQCNKQHIDNFLALCTIAGHRTSFKCHPPVGYGKQSFYKIRIFSDRCYHSAVENINFHGGKNTKRIIGKPKSLYPNQPNINYIGRVWCPETEYGSFIARRNGTIYLTGNSYIDDMKSEALLTLCQNAFKYDEERFDNPFGYYTQIIKYCFITFLEKEEIVRDIKDSLWESIGMTPSYARQIKNQILDNAREAAMDRANENGTKDQIHKTIKSLKKEVDSFNDRITRLSEIIINITKSKTANVDIDLEISEALETDPQPYTGDVEACLSLFIKAPVYKIETGIEVADQTVSCLTLYDDSTKSNTKKIIPDTEDTTVILSLCTIALTIRRDLLVKELRDISGYNVSATKIPTTEKTPYPIESSEFPEQEEYSSQGDPKRKMRKKNA